MPEHLLFVILPNVFRVAKGVHIRADDDQGSVVLGFDLGSTEIRVDHGWILVGSWLNHVFAFRFRLPTRPLRRTSEVCYMLCCGASTERITIRDRPFLTIARLHSHILRTRECNLDNK